MRWMEDVLMMRQDREQMTVETIKGLIESGRTILHFPEFELVLGELHELLVRIEHWELKAKNCLDSK